MEICPGNPRFLRGNSGNQETYQVIQREISRIFQKFQDAVLDSPGLSSIIQDPSDLLIKVLKLQKYIKSILLADKLT